MAIINRVADFHQDMTFWRQSLHAHPELGYEEVWTSDFIAKKLASFGIEVHRGLAKTGVVGVLKGRTDKGGKIALRADMDALAMPEANSFAHKSTRDGRMHACGHDGHMAMLLGAARYLSETRQFDGTVYFYFQPAEEGGAGAKQMMDDGLFEKFDADSVWGMHNWPGLEAGHIAISRGACMASADHFYISIRGCGSHAAMPHQATDPVLASAAIIQSLQSIVARQTNPVDSAVVSVTMVNGGSAFNVIPDEVQLGGTARAILPETRQMAEDNIRKIVTSLASAHGCEAEIDWRGGIPYYQSPRRSRPRCGNCGRGCGCRQMHMDLPPSMAAEDFAFMLEARKGAYIWLGAGPAQEGRMLHNTGYDFNDSILPVGTSYWVKLVESELAS